MNPGLLNVDKADQTAVCLFSVTESEVEEGLLNVDKADETAVCFTRNIPDINPKDAKACKFVNS